MAEVNAPQVLQATLNKWTGGNDFQQKDVKGLHGLTAVVTGGAGGIGYEVSKALALAGAKVIALSRKAEHGDETRDKIHALAEENENHDGPDAIGFRFVACDFGDLKQVKKVADQLAQEIDRIDILILNAGIGVSNYAMDSDDIERIFGVNVIGHVLFVNRLLPTLRKTAQKHNVTPRVVALTSNLHKLAPSDATFTSLEELNDGGKLRADQYYARSKLGIILYTRALVRHAIKPHESKEKIFVCSVHPGAVDTEIQDQFVQAFGVVLGKAIKWLQTPMLRAADEGSLGTLWAAVAPEATANPELQGAYVTDPGKWGGETDAAKDEKLQENVWNLCTKLIKEKAGQDALYDWGKGSGGTTSDFKS